MTWLLPSTRSRCAASLSRAFALFCLGVVLFLILCPPLQAASAPESRRFTDSLGRTVEIPAIPRRIVTLSPSNTECVHALGAGASLVGVTSFCDYPESVKGLPKVGGFAARTINIEAIIALKPDLVLAGDANHLPVVQTLEQLGVKVVSVKVRGFEELGAKLMQLGAILGREREAGELVASIQVRVAAVRSRVAGIPVDKRVRVYWEVFDEPLMSCGPQSTIGQLIELAGGRNIFAELRDEFPQVSAEAVIARAPDVIMGPELMRARSLSLERLRARSGWEAVPAVRSGKLHILPDSAVARPGPRLVDGLELIARCLYPETFAGEQAP